MISDFGFRINKHLKIAFVIGVIDLIIFYIIGRLNNDMAIFNLIIGNWKYISLFISILTFFIYSIDILFFCNRKSKYRFLLLTDEPFKVWNKYIYQQTSIRKEDLKLNFYSQIYVKVADKNKIKSIMEDEILVRDICIHIITTNSILILLFCLLESINYDIALKFFVGLFVISLFINLVYRQLLKYYINEIYVEYTNCLKK